MQKDDITAREEKYKIKYKRELHSPTDIFMSLKVTECWFGGLQNVMRRLEIFRIGQDKIVPELLESPKLVKFTRERLEGTPRDTSRIWQKSPLWRMEPCQLFS